MCLYLKRIIFLIVKLLTCSCQTKLFFVPSVVAQMYVFLFVVESAPISSFDLPPLFTEAAERAKTLVEKILRDIPTVYAATIYTEVIKMTKLLLKLFSYCLFSSLFNNLFLFPSGFDS